MERQKDRRAKNKKNKKNSKTERNMKNRQTERQKDRKTERQKDRKQKEKICSIQIKIEELVHRQNTHNAIRNIGMLKKDRKCFDQKY